MFPEYNYNLCVNDVCEILMVGSNRVYELLNSGLLRGFRIGRTWRIPKKNLEAFIIQRSRVNH